MNNHPAERKDLADKMAKQATGFISCLVVLGLIFLTVLVVVGFVAIAIKLIGGLF